MIDFTREILPLIHSRGQWESLEDDEAHHLFKAAMSLPEGSTIVEIGSQLGRSSVMLATVAKERHHELHFIDIWVDGIKYAQEWLEAMAAIGYPFDLHYRRSETVTVPSFIALLYIDGDHERLGIVADCTRYLPWVQSGGYVAFHDYGRWSLPDVKPVVDEYMEPSKWEPMGVVRTLAMWRRR